MKEKIIKLLDDLIQHNIHTSPDHDFSYELNDRVLALRDELHIPHPEPKREDKIIKLNQYEHEPENYFIVAPSKEIAVEMLNQNGTTHYRIEDFYNHGEMDVVQLNTTNKLSQFKKEVRNKINHFISKQEVSLDAILASFKITEETKEMARNDSELVIRILTKLLKEIRNEQSNNGTQ